MKLESLGFDKKFYSNDIGEYLYGRVIAEHKERYIVGTVNGEINAEIDGRLRFDATKREDFPAVGDWVSVSLHGDMAIIHQIFKRKTTLARLASGKSTDKQIIATNIDYAIIVLAADRDFNVNRMERYLTICNDSDIEPLVVLNKTDLINEKTILENTNQITSRAKDVRVFTSSNVTKDGFTDIMNALEKGKTYCLLGSSGVGKSSLLNNLVGKTKMETAEIGEKTNRGKHVTTHRELVVLESGAILIDNPGMREVGIADDERGLDETFKPITSLFSKCRFRDCSHSTELDCAVLEAIDSGDISQDSYDNYMRMNRERAHYESSVLERRQKDKAFGKMVKQHMKAKRKQKDN